MLTLQLLDTTFSVHRLAPNKSIPNEVFSAEVYFIAKTDEELSLVIPSELEINSDKVEAPWKALKVQGPLDFSLTGILAKISHVLAQEKISIFAISSFDTDYILVNKADTEKAISTLEKNQYKIVS